MRTAESVRLLETELNGDITYILESYNKWKSARARADENGGTEDLDLAAVGFYLHNLYNACEAYFLRIVKHFENSLSAETWHRDLLERMTLSIPTVRPALLSSELYDRLEELRRFRHVVRNLYKSRLHPQKMRIVEDAIRGIDEDFGAAHRKYIAWLERLAEELEAAE